MSDRRPIDVALAGLRNREFFRSPEAWEDEVLYFLMLDRFSDGQEIGYRDNDGRVVTTGTTTLFQPADAGNALRTEPDAQRWRDAGGRFVGGTLKGRTPQSGDLPPRRAAAIWVSPGFEQVAAHGPDPAHGIQHSLGADPHCGSREDLRDMVATAHAHGIRVILDIILNHTGDVFAYAPDRYPAGTGFDPRWDGRPYRVLGFRDTEGV